MQIFAKVEEVLNDANRSIATTGPPGFKTGSYKTPSFSTGEANTKRM